MKKFIKVSIYKCGGKLLSDTHHLLAFLNHVLKDRKIDEVVIFVFSAFAGITRLLDEKIFSSAVRKDRESLKDYLEEFKRIHFGYIEALFENNGKRKHVRDVFTTEYRTFVSFMLGKREFSKDDQAYISGFGEICSKKIMDELIFHVSGYANVNNLDARAVIKTIGWPSSAQILKEISAEKFFQFFEMEAQSSPIFTIHGYIGEDSETGKTTNMGYDSSDVTAGFLASIIAEKYQNIQVIVHFKKDVRGVYRDNRNPILGIFPAMTKNNYLEFSIMKMGEVPVRTDTVDLVNKGSNVKFVVSSYLDLSDPGTTISFD